MWRSEVPVECLYANSTQNGVESLLKAFSRHTRTDQNSAAAKSDPCRWAGILQQGVTSTALSWLIRYLFCRKNRTALLYMSSVGVSASDSCRQSGQAPDLQGKEDRKRTLGTCRHLEKGLRCDEKRNAFDTLLDPSRQSVRRIYLKMRLCTLRHCLGDFSRREH